MIALILNKTAKQKREIVTISSSKELEFSAGITPLYLAHQTIDR